jgi:hypothetical protein
MLEELERRNYSENTTRRYLRFVERFAQHFGKSPLRTSRGVHSNTGGNGAGTKAE